MPEWQLKGWNVFVFVMQSVSAMFAVFSIYDWLPSVLEELRVKDQIYFLWVCLNALNQNVRHTCNYFKVNSPFCWTFSFGLVLSSSSSVLTAGSFLDSCRSIFIRSWVSVVSLSIFTSCTSFWRVLRLSQNTVSKYRVYSISTLFVLSAVG